VRAVVSRVAWARVVTSGEVVGEIDHGLLVLVGVAQADAQAEADWVAGKVAALRVFDDEHGRMNRSVHQIGGGVLVVSQFTLYGDARNGRRPSYIAAARPEQAEPLVQAVVDALAASGVPVATGRFGAHMRVESSGDGPVTILLDTERRS
jgi:D-tyrosyl-tRNA(Tyr) deacylase